MEVVSEVEGRALKAVTVAAAPTGVQPPDPGQEPFRAQNSLEKLMKFKDSAEQNLAPKHKTRA